MARRLMSSQPKQDGRALQNAFLRAVKKNAESGSSPAHDSSSSVPSSSPSTPSSAATKKVDQTPSQDEVSKMVKKEVSSTPPADSSSTKTAPGIFEFAPRITVVGVGGGGCNAVNNMIDRGLTGVEFLSCNTDAQHLLGCKTDNRIQMGKVLTQGLGCGANPNDGYFIS